VVVSIPVDLSGLGDEELANLEEKGAKGRYVSVERLVELEDGKIEWQMKDVYRVSSRRAVWQAKCLRLVMTLFRVP
jgi:hypothetical protein